MSGQISKKYDDYGCPIVMQFDAVSVVGTSAAIAALAATTTRLPFAMKLRGATRVSTTGGTAAGPTVTIDYSLAGTGSFVAIGTCAFGTDASGYGSDFTVTETALADGDHIRIATAAGTAAATHTVNFCLEFVDVYT